MLGASRAALDALLVEVRQRAGEGGSEVTSGLLATADALGSHPSLAVALTDTGLSSDVRSGVADDLLAPVAGPVALPLVRIAVAMRWSRPADLVEGLEAAAATQAFVVADREGTLGAVEEAIFAFERAVAGSGELQLALNDPSLTTAQQVAIARDLTESRFPPIAVELICFAVSHTRGQRLDSLLNRLLELAAQSRGMVLAEVTTAVPLTATETERLEAALARVYHRPVRIQAQIDPAVVGGVLVQVGDEQIDGTLASRRDQLARRLAG